MAQKPKLRSRYCVKMQGLFSGVEWSVFRDGRVVATGEAPDVDSGLLRARHAYRVDVSKSQRRGYDA